jgi:2-polyprenyl-3-methyl-5-hydroxy-6-metoxy-1,4-benzoquinol methylase
MIELTAAEEGKVEEFAGRLSTAFLGTMELANVELGVRLGLYKALAGKGPVSADELAQEAGIAGRYAQEWLEQQAVAGVVECDDAAKPAKERRFTLPNAHAHVLMEDDSDACMKACAAAVPWVGKALEIMVTEFRLGTGASFGVFGLHDVQAAFSRPGFANHLTQHWLPALPDVQEKLSANKQVRIAEVGCGEGVAAITIAKAYPNAEVVGYDLDEASIAVARTKAADAGVDDRVRFEMGDAGALHRRGDYDLVMAIEMLHDVPDPVAVLRTMQHLAGDTGAVLVVDERTEDRFTVPTSEQERLLYAFSTLHCLAVGMQDGGAATGTVFRIDTLRRYADEAGFSSVEALDVDHPQFRLYRLA